ncbi:hypothetical protein ABK040_008840 [Willaertia magna]
MPHEFVFHQYPLNRFDNHSKPQEEILINENSRSSCNDTPLIIRNNHNVLSSTKDNSMIDSENSNNSLSNGSKSNSSDKHVPKCKKLESMTAEDIKQYFKYTQTDAARLLQVSVSTLKRKFYELQLGNRWPYKRVVSTNNNVKRKINGTKRITKKEKKIIKNDKLTISYLLNTIERDEKYITEEVWKVFKVVFP